ncbi:glycosyltransferase family 2 protein [Parabacteroides sp. FAFU027]|uniref:glycosyltransferase family 2 protein n=1 Tax=Parabacteroides sp. FAFU027 TaxID=2922715 RepID=UPI001FB00064|nr:glycosyltransferase family 2 protein [Parabacteroides sp. FAFU027]
MNNPLISVIIPAYNASKFIRMTVESVLNQSYADFELIVVNDGSTDDTLYVLESINDRRIRIYSQVNKGQDAAFNYGYSLSIGEYIKFMDADDVISKETLEIQLLALKKDNEKIAYGEWYRFFGSEPNQTDIKSPMSYWKDMDPMEFLIQDEDGPMLQCGIMLIPRHIIDKSGLWHEELILYNDTEFFTRIILNSKGIVFTKGAQLFYRSGLTTSLTSQNSRKYFESTFKATGLLATNMLHFEDSKKVRKVIANIYFRRLYDMYPLFPDLAEKHIERIDYYGGSNLMIKSGAVYNLLCVILGWRIAKRLLILSRKFK